MNFRVKKYDNKMVVCCGCHDLNNLGEMGRLRSVIVTFPGQTHARIERGDRGEPPPPTKNRKIIGFLSTTGPDHMINRKAIKPAFSVGPSSARHNGVSLAGRDWPAYRDVWFLPPLIN